MPMLNQDSNQKIGSAKLWVMIFILLFFTYAYCKQEPYNVNAITRTAMVVGILENGSARIDKYQAFTCDKALYEGHYYSDKAPGLSLAAMPSMTAAYAVLKTAGKADCLDAATKQPTNAFRFLTVIGTIFTSGLSTALAAAVLGWICLWLGCTRGGAVFVSLTFALATPTWGWATSFFGHAMAGSCCLLGFAAAIFMLETDMSPRKNMAGWILAGGLLGYSVLVEYTLAVACLIIGLMILWKLAMLGKERVVPALIGLTIGVLPAAITFFTYNYLIFGTFFDFGYKHEVLFPGMDQGFMGISMPKLPALDGIILSSRRGILWFSPILALTPLAFWASLHYRKIRIYMLAASTVVVYFIAMNSSYFYWDGGCSTGPRLLTPALGFACFPLGFLWTSSGRIIRTFMVCAFAVSFLTSMACTLVTMNIDPNAYAYPLFQKLIPDLLSGRIINMGQLYGIPGYWSILPLFLLWTVCARHIARLTIGNEISEAIPNQQVRPYGPSHIGKIQKQAA
jgi:hypothetical protein